MRMYEFGDKNKKAIMLLPGTCCHWKNNFSNVIDLLSEHYFVICASYDGFDETEDTEFLDMLTEVNKIETYIIKNLKGEIHAVYGCSLGGSFVALMAQRNKIHMKHGILGSSDLDKASSLVAMLETNFMLLLIYNIIHKGQIPKFIEKRILKKAGKEYANKLFEMMGVGKIDMSFVTKNSIKNQFYTDLITKIQENIQVQGTTIHCFYAAKMGEKYKNRYKRYFEKPHIVEHNLFHEELLLCRPKEWVKNIELCVG